jgi:hypothetical protein
MMSDSSGKGMKARVAEETSRYFFPDANPLLTRRFEFALILRKAVIP